MATRRKAITGTSSRKRRLKPVIGRKLALSPAFSGKFLAELGVEVALGRYDVEVKLGQRMLTLLLTERK